MTGHAEILRKTSFEDAPVRYEMTPQNGHDSLVDIGSGELTDRDAAGSMRRVGPA